MFGAEVVDRADRDAAAEAAAEDGERQDTAQPADPADDVAIDAEEQEIDQLLDDACRAARGERIGRLRKGVSQGTDKRDKQPEILRKLAETKVQTNE